MVTAVVVFSGTLLTFYVAPSFATCCAEEHVAVCASPYSVYRRGAPGIVTRFIRATGPELFFVRTAASFGHLHLS